MAEAGEIDESSTQKRPFIPNIEEPAETPLLRKKANKGGSKFDEVWKYFIQGEEVNPGIIRFQVIIVKKNGQGVNQQF